MPSSGGPEEEPAAAAAAVGGEPAASTAAADTGAGAVVPGVGTSPAAEAAEVAGPERCSGAVGTAARVGVEQAVPASEQVWLGTVSKSIRGDTVTTAAGPGTATG